MAIELDPPSPLRPVVGQKQHRSVVVLKGISWGIIREDAVVEEHAHDLPEAIVSCITFFG
jgi:hypothetical protein